MRKNEGVQANVKKWADCMMARKESFDLFAKERF